MKKEQTETRLCPKCGAETRDHGPGLPECQHCDGCDWCGDISQCVVAPARTPPADPHVCEKCGSASIEFRVNIDPNDGNRVVAGAEDPDDVWCDACDTWGGGSILRSAYRELHPDTPPENSKSWEPCCDGCLGWGVFHSDTYGHEIERCQDCDRFADDFEAAMYALRHDRAALVEQVHGAPERVLIPGLNGIALISTVPEEEPNAV